MLARLGKCPGSALAGVAWDFTGTRGMRRHDERSAAGTRSVSHGAVFLRALVALAFVLISTGTIPWAGAVPGAFAAVSPDADAITAVAQNDASGQANVIVEPLYGRAPVALRQQDAEDATAGATGANGTVNGVPREATEVAPVTTGPGAPLAPGDVVLPPSVPALPEPGVDSAAPGAIGATTEVTFDAVSDTTVFTAQPNASQSPESAPLLAIGGPQGAVALISFDVSGIGEGTILSALLTFTGAGDAGAPGGSVGVIYDYIARDGLTANEVPGGGTALNVHGVPSWFEAVEPGGLTAVDVTGSVSGDGKITFVMPGQPDATGSIDSTESGVPPQLVLTVAQPA
jgi:hypothetical protein